MSYTTQLGMPGGVTILTRRTALGCCWVAAVEVETVLAEDGGKEEEFGGGVGVSSSVRVGVPRGPTSCTTHVLLMQS